jgi:MoaA/NifB/PqqE/SkfB family radical SAM enzyme
MEITGLHLLLSYQCTFECDHCFVWGSPNQRGTMTIGQVRNILTQVQEMDTVRSIYFEGGEPFLFYPVMLKGVQEAKRMGLGVGIVSNAYWAEDEETACEWLQPLVGYVDDLTVSSDLFHYSEKLSKQAQNARLAAEQLGIPVGMICVAQPGESGAAAVGQIPEGESQVMYRGRAAVKLAPHVEYIAWETFNECPHEDLRNPGRLHVDAYGNLHICQGIVIGNMFEEPLKDILARHDPELHYITGPLLLGGPAQLSRTYGVERQAEYADACHICYETRRLLRWRFKKVLAPDEMYGGANL